MRERRRITFAAVMLAAAVSLPACGGTSNGPLGLPRLTATMDQLQGPWSARPYVLDPALVTAMDAACRRDMPTFPVGVELAVYDARGKGILQVHFAGADGAMATCNDMAILPRGDLARAGGGRTTNPNPVQQLGEHEIRLVDQSGSGRFPDISSSSISGIVGSGIERVVVEIPGQALIEPSRSDRWFAVWIPGAWPPGTKVRGLDASGEQVAEQPLS